MLMRFKMLLLKESDELTKLFMSKEQLSPDNFMTSHKTLYKPQNILAEDLMLKHAKRCLPQ